MRAGTKIFMFLTGLMFNCLSAKEGHVRAPRVVELARDVQKHLDFNFSAKKCTRLTTGT